MQAPYRQAACDRRLRSWTLTTPTGSSLGKRRPRQPWRLRRVHQPRCRARGGPTNTAATVHATRALAKARMPKRQRRRRRQRLLIGQWKPAQRYKANHERR